MGIYTCISFALCTANRDHSITCRDRSWACTADSQIPFDCLCSISVMMRINGLVQSYSLVLNACCSVFIRDTHSDPYPTPSLPGRSPIILPLASQGYKFLLRQINQYVVGKPFSRTCDHPLLDIQRTKSSFISRDQFSGVAAFPVITWTWPSQTLASVA